MLPLELESVGYLSGNWECADRLLEVSLQLLSECERF